MAATTPNPSHASNVRHATRDAALRLQEVMTTRIPRAARTNTQWEGVTLNAISVTNDMTEGYLNDPSERIALVTELYGDGVRFCITQIYRCTLDAISSIENTFRKEFVEAFNDRVAAMLRREGDTGGFSLWTYVKYIERNLQPISVIVENVNGAIDEQVATGAIEDVRHNISELLRFIKVDQRRHAAIYESYPSFHATPLVTVLQLRDVYKTILKNWNAFQKSVYETAAANNSVSALVLAAITQN
jgi:hypothetical protein